MYRTLKFWKVFKYLKYQENSKTIIQVTVQISITPKLQIILINIKNG